jgi:hypothetical protein
VPRGLSRAELLNLPAVVDLETAALALQLGRTKAYELARTGRFARRPTVRCRRRWSADRQRREQPARVVRGQAAALAAIADPAPGKRSSYRRGGSGRGGRGTPCLSVCCGPYTTQRSSYRGRRTSTASVTLPSKGQELADVAGALIGLIGAP